MRIRPKNAVDLRGLAGRQVLPGIEALAAGQEALATQDLVEARDASGKPVARVEERGVGVGELMPEGEKGQGALAPVLSRSLYLLSGLAPRMPNLAWLMVLAVFGLLGIPLMASFPAEAMTFFGSFKPLPVGAFAVAAGLATVAVALAIIVHRVLFGAPNPDAPGVSDAALGETWYLGLLAGGLLWVGVFPGGPKLPGTDTPIFDPGIVNTMAAGISDIADPFALK